MIEAVAAMQSILSELSSLAAAATAPAAPQPADGAATTQSFGDVFAAALGRLDAGVSGANATAAKFAAGADDIPLSDVMVSLEQANLGMQLAATVRDKIVAAYTNVMNMPV